MEEVNPCFKVVAVIGESGNPPSNMSIGWGSGAEKTGDKDFFTVGSEYFKHYSQLEGVQSSIEI